MYYKEVGVDEIALLPQGMRPPLKPLSKTEREEMKQSMKKDGILQNLVISERRENGKVSFVLEAGYTRLAIAKELGMKTVPCLVNTGPEVVYLRGGTDAFRRNLFGEQREELLNWMDVERKSEAEILKELAAKGRQAEDPGGKDKGKNASAKVKEDPAVKKELQKTKEALAKSDARIKAVETEMGDLKATKKKELDGVNAKLSLKKKEADTLSEKLQKSEDIIEQLRFQKATAAAGASKAEIDKVTKEKIKDEVERNSRLSKELEQVKKEKVELEEAKTKAENGMKGMVANYTAILADEREKYRAKHERFLIMTSLNEIIARLEELIPMHVDKISEYVKRNEVRIEMDKVSELAVKTQQVLTAVINAINAIPLMPEKEEDIV